VHHFTLAGFRIEMQLAGARNAVLLTELYPLNISASWFSSRSARGVGRTRTPVAWPRQNSRARAALGETALVCALDQIGAPAFLVDNAIGRSAAALSLTPRQREVLESRKSATKFGLWRLPIPLRRNPR
jgi:hypothetical protein